MTKIIGISGISGSGKTTLTKALGIALKATTVFWDDYDEHSTGPVDYVKWYETSRDYSAWHYDSLVEVLNKLKSEKKTTCPATQKELIPTEYVIFDAPLGYKHTATGNYIDTLIHIDIPLDIALSRRMIRDYTSSEKGKEELLEDLQFYLNSSRKVFVYAATREKEGSHLIINGDSSIDEQLQFIVSYLRNKQI